MDAQILPLVPLALPAVLLPGSTLCIRTSDRLDITAILADHHRSTHTKTRLHIVCSTSSSPANIATLATVIGIRGRKQSDLQLVVRGITRVKIHHVIQEPRYFRASVMPIDVRVGNATVAALTHELDSLRIWAKDAALESFLAAAVAQRDGLALPEELVKAAGGLQAWTTGEMADVLAAKLTLTIEEKLEALEAVDQQQRMGVVIDILQQQLGGVAVPQSQAVVSQKLYDWAQSMQMAGSEVAVSTSKAESLPGSPPSSRTSRI